MPTLHFSCREEIIILEDIALITNIPIDGQV